MKTISYLCLAVTMTSALSSCVRPRTAAAITHTINALSQPAPPSRPAAHQKPQQRHPETRHAR